MLTAMPAPPTTALPPWPGPGRRTSFGLATVLAASWLGACGGGDPASRYLDWDGSAAFDLAKQRLPTWNRVGAGPLGLTSDSASDSITVVDLAAHKVLAVLPIGRNPVDVDGPYHLGFDRARNHLFVGLASPGLPGSGAHGHGESSRPGWVQQWRLSPFELLGERLVANNPADLGLSADGKRLVVGHFDLVRAAGGTTLAAKRAVLTVFPVSTGALGLAFEVPVCVAPHGVALSRPDATTAWVACYGEDALAVVTLAGTPTATLVPMPDGQGKPGAPMVGPSAVRLSPAGDRVAVTTSVGLDLKIFDVATRAFVGTGVPLLATPMWPAWSLAGDLLWVPTQHADAVKVVASDSGTVLVERTFSPAECRSPHEAVLADDGKTLWLVCAGTGKVPGKLLTLDPTSLATRGEVAVGLHPVQLVVVPR